MQKYGGWWDSVKNFLSQFGPAKQPSRPAPKAPAPVVVPETPVSRPPEAAMDFAQAIAEAARQKVLLQMRYKGVLRYVEPYSYRWFSTGKHFMGYCYRDHRINSFKPERIEMLQLTDIPFTPRWPVEIGVE